MTLLERAETVWMVAAAAKSLQSCLTLFDPIDGSQSGSPVPGILQARTLVWAAISFSNACVLVLLLFSRSVVSDSLWPHGLQHARLPCPSPSPGVCSKPTSLEAVSPSSHLILCCLLLLLLSVFPSIRVFSDELTLCIRWPRTVIVLLGLIMINS